jgi:hypothetical protein
MFLSIQNTQILIYSCATGVRSLQGNAPASGTYRKEICNFFFDTFLISE